MDTSAVDPAILSVDAGTKPKKGRAKRAQMTGYQIPDSQIPVSQIPEPQIPETQGIQALRRRGPAAGKGKTSIHKDPVMASKTRNSNSSGAAKTTNSNATTSNATAKSSSGRAIKRSIKAVQALDDKALKEAANSLAVSRQNLKRKREEFAL